ncbi:MAG: Ig-like domain-containing protein, partial [Thermanaerothrix sp.]|nr:Ig-like domain-containing protein [Thermanaerothrix sp.]
MIPAKVLRKWGLLLSLLVALGTIAATATPPAEPYRLGLRRNFGYGGGSQIRGDFTLSLVPESGVSRVTFFIDGQPMATITTPPFRFRFNTGDYPLGWHELSAEVVTSEGQVFYTPARRVEFVSAEVERQAMVQILVPLLGG